MKIIDTTAITRAVEIVGTQAFFAKAIKRSRSHVNQWLTGNTTVSLNVCPAIEKLTGGKVTAEQLRPDFDWAALRTTRGKNES